jgi:LPLT family lysophospholipid transporter-like MFS transporter
LNQGDIGSQRGGQRGFGSLIAAQFVSGLADNALLLVAMAWLLAEQAALWMAPVLKLVFTLAYVLLAPFVGPGADRWPKARVMFVANALKATACAGMLIGLPVLVAFCLAGLGAALYSPAKYGLVTELVPPQRLVVANAWIEVSTVVAILLGTLLGGALTDDFFAQATRAWAERALPMGLAVVLFLFLARQPPPVGRSLGPDFAGYHHGVLGRRGQLAVPGDSLGR